MTLLKLLYINSTEGIAQEAATTDQTTLGKISLTGVSGVSVDAGGMSVTNLPTPVNASDATTKSYVDAIAQGLSAKTDASVLSASNISSLSGVGVVIDGVTTTAGMRVLLTNQTTGTQNGLWVVNSGAWTRPTDAPTGYAAAGIYVFIKAGTTYADTGWVCTNAPGSDIVDTNALTFSQFTGAGAITVGNGLGKTGNNLYVVLASNSGLQFTGAALDHLLVSGGGLQKGASGLSVQLNSNNTLASDTNGMRVLGVPAAFTVAGTAVDSNVIATALNALCDGPTSIADAYHNHNFINGATLLQAGSQTIGATACSAGDPVGWSSVANVLMRGDAAASTTARITGVMAAAVAANGSGTLIRAGVAPGVLTGATPGTPYFLAVGGGLTTTLPTGVGQRGVRIGFAKNATDLDVRITDIALRSAS